MGDSFGPRQQRLVTAFDYNKPLHQRGIRFEDLPGNRRIFRGVDQCHSPADSAHQGPAEPTEDDPVE